MQEVDSNVANLATVGSQTQLSNPALSLPNTPNRKQRRVEMAFRAKNQRFQQGMSKRRLEAFHKLQDWKAKATKQAKLTEQQINDVFKVALSKIFKQDFKEHMSFETKLAAIVKNVKSGFVYDVIKAEAEETVSDT